MSRLALLLALAPSAARAQTPAPPTVGGSIHVRDAAPARVGLPATLNRARFAIDGPLPSQFTYRLLVETEAATGRLTPASVSLREAMLKWSPGSFALTAGQFKAPFSREYLIP